MKTRSNKTTWLSGSVLLLGLLLLSVFYWQLSWYASICLGILLIVFLYGYLVANFRNSINKERLDMLWSSKKYVSPKSHDIQQLPLPVQNWLTSSGAMQAEPSRSVFLKQQLRMQMDPDKPKWLKATADQIITISPPAFNWSVKVKTGLVNGITGRDQFKNGKGEMVIKLASLLPVAKSKSNKKVDQASLQRFLAEMVWYPTAALCPYISWESIDAHSARATMSFQGTTGSGVFYFDQGGAFKEFRAKRYKETGPEAQPLEWIITTEKTETREGITIPVQLTATWKLEQGDWTWLKMKLSEIAYNVQQEQE